MVASLTFPVIANKEYKNAFNAFAREKGRSMAELVREALDAKYGEELKPYLSFFESAVDRNQQVSVIEQEADPA